MTSRSLIISHPRHPTYVGGSGNEPHEVFAKQLYNRVLGHALFAPTSTERCERDQLYALSTFQRGGLEIGDVGYLKDGTIKRIFNVLDSSSGDDRGLPPTPFSSFPVPSGSWNPFHQARYIPRGETFVSKETSEDVKDLGIAVPIDPTATGLITVGGSIQFRSKTDNTAVLGLPTGADWDELSNVGMLKRYIRKNGLDWIRYINAQLQCEATNGSVLLVTAYVTSKTYATAVATSRARDQSTRFSITLGPFLANIGRTLSWTHDSGLRTHVQPGHGITKGEDEMETKYYPFVRGYLLSVVKNLRTLFRTKVFVENGNSGTLPFSEFGKMTNAKYTRNDQSSESKQSGDGSSSSSRHTLADLKNISDDGYHPLQLINDILFDLEPRAVMAISHDDNLTALLQEGEAIPDREVLKQRMMAQCHWQFDEGTGTVSLDLPNEKLSSTREDSPTRLSAQLSDLSVKTSDEVKRRTERRPSAAEPVKYPQASSKPEESMRPNKADAPAKKQTKPQLAPSNLSTPHAAPRHVHGPPTSRLICTY